MKAWTGTGEAYAASYAELCLGTAGALIAELGAPAGRSLLDVGSGTGALAARLAQAGWEAVGCEPEPTMRAVSGREHPDISVRTGALPALPFPDAAFDAVTANFVLNHVGDPRVAAGEMARVSGGLLAATIWTRSPSWLWLEVRDAAGLDPAAARGLPADKDFERTTDGFARMLAEAGWRDVRSHELVWAWQVAPETLWASAEGGVASAGALYLGLGEQDRQAFRRAFDDVCSRHAVDGILHLEHVAAIAIGRTTPSP
jgi:SAM-dependent methyltransferase